MGWGRLQPSARDDFRTCGEHSVTCVDDTSVLSAVKTWAMSHTGQKLGLGAACLVTQR